LAPVDFLFRPVGLFVGKECVLWKNSRLDRAAVWGGQWEEVGPRSRVLDGRAQWRHLANTIEGLCSAAIIGSTTSGCDAACSQNTLGNLYHFISVVHKVAQSILGTGRVATAGGRPSYSLRAQPFNRICQVAPLCTPI